MNETVEKGKGIDFNTQLTEWEKTISALNYRTFEVYPITLK
jgi:hypothetical protein